MRDTVRGRHRRGCSSTFWHPKRDCDRLCENDCPGSSIWLSCFDYIVGCVINDRVGIALNAICGDDSMRTASYRREAVQDR